MTTDDDSCTFIRRSVTAAAALTVIGVSACATVAPAEPGVDLASWQSVGADVWRAAATTAESGPAAGTGFLVSTDTWGDFALSLEYWVEDSTNSGIFIRCSDPAEITPANCYEINIWDNHPTPSKRTGGIVDFTETLTTIDGLERWVRVDIETRGRRIVARFDGRTTAVIDDDRSLRGHVALQYGGTGLLRMRNLVVRPLSSGK